jgi:flagellar biogenesis protein FliO
MALVVWLIALGAAATCFAQVVDTPPEDAAPAGAIHGAPTSGRLDDPWSSPEIAPQMDPKPLVRNRGAAGTNESQSAAAPSSNSWVRTTTALAAVVGLIVLLAWGYRVVMANGDRLRGALTGRQGGLMEVVGRTTLAPRQSLCLVRIGPRLVLVGLTHDAVRAIDVIDDPELTARLLGEAARNRPDSHTAEFDRCLEREARSYSDAVDDVDETITPDESRVQEIKEKLAGTIRRLQASAASA